MAAVGRGLWPYLVIVAGALLVWTPTLFFAQAGESFGYDLNWSEQFSRLFGAGALYPRWTPASFAGLGSPTFYFYPPLAFWVTALIAKAGGAALTATLALKLAVLFFFVTSGLGMYQWLRLSAATGRAVLGALLFMAAPYHLDDTYIRGAFAEFAAIAVLPILALGLARTAKSDRSGPLWLAAGWAAMLFAHLPIALLAGVLLVAPYGLWLAWRTPPSGRLAYIARSGAALALGTGLAAIYLIPALQLQDAISADYWWSAKFHAADRLFANPKSWSMPLEPFLAGLSIAEALIALAVAWGAWRSGDRAATFWAGVVIGVFLVVAGLVPGFWSLPLMAKVQFPWRALTVQEFALATLLALAAPRVKLGLPLVLFAALLTANLASVGEAIAQWKPNAQFARPGYGVTTFPTIVDAPEYLPNGMLRLEADGPAPALNLLDLARAPLASGAGVVAGADAQGIAVHVRLAPGPGRQIILRRFYFPSWRAACDGRLAPVRPATPARFVALSAPAGVSACDISLGETPQERVGQLASLVSLAAIAAYGLWAVGPLRRRPRLT